MSIVKRKVDRRQFLKTVATVASGVVFASWAQPALAAQTGQAATPVPGSGACGVTAAGTFPIAKDKVDLSILMVQSPLVKDMPTNELTVEYEQRTNVHVNWQMVPQQGLIEKRNLVLASGSYPDIFMGMGIPLEDQALYGSRGVFMPLNDLIEKQTVHLKKLLADYPRLKDLLTAPDGKIYALGHDSQCFHCTMPQKMWINQKWLDKLGLKMPTTTEEFAAVLKAFKDKDPNGNGKADEIPLMGSTDGGIPSISGFLMCSFVYDDGGNRFTLNNGKIEVSFNKPEWKDGLAYLRQLCADKLLDPTSFTTTSVDLRKVGEKEDAQILGASPALYPGTFQSMAGERHKDYMPVPPLKGPKGVQLAAWNPFTAVLGEFTITKSCKCPEVAMRWIDWFFSTEGGLRSRIGREGKEWRKATPEEKGLDGRPAVWIKLTPINEPQNFFWGQINIPQQFIHSEQSSCDDPINCLETRLYSSTKKYYEPYKPADVVPPLWVPSADLARYGQLQTELNSYVNQSLARFVTGELDVQKDWDNYVKQLNQIGLADYLAIAQKAYDSKYKK